MTNASRSLLRQRDVALLWSAGLMIFIGNYAMFVALPLLVYRQTSSPLATAITVLGWSIPQVMVSQFAGVIADRLDRRRLLIVTNLGLAVLTLGYVFLAEAPWWALALVAFVTSSVSPLAGPAEHALLPELVPPHRLGEAASLNTLNNSLGRLLGPALGGVLFAQIGFAAAAALNAAMYLVAGVLVALVAAVRPHSVPTSERRGWRAEWLGGLTEAWHHPRLRPVIALIGMVMFGEGFISALLAPFVDAVVGGGGQTLGWLLSAQAVGGVAGSWWAAGHADRWEPLRLLGVAALASGAFLVVIFNYVHVYPAVWPAIMLSAVAGIPFAIFAAAQGQALQVYSPPALRGRIFSLAFGVAGLLQLTGIGVAGLSAEIWGAVMINVDAVTYLAAGVAAVWITRVRTAPGGKASSRRGKRR